MILVKGGLPGSKEGWVLVSDAVKKALPEDAPMPAAFRAPAVEEAPAEEAAPVEAEAAPAAEAAAEGNEE